MSGPTERGILIADPWGNLAERTPARIALGRAGASLPTSEVLRFGLAHARARDAVHAALDVSRAVQDIAALGFDVVTAHSAAPDRATYLVRPDLGRRLDPPSQAALQAAAAGPVDLVFAVGDGLSATAVHAHAAALLGAMQPHLLHRRWSVGPVVVARQARVALGDEIGQALQARMVVMLIGERPGLSAPDSLGAYLTFDPRVGRSDAERNCISNIRPAGLPPEVAADKLAWLIGEALRRQRTGVTLKDESGLALSGGPTPSLPAP
jgi:ethanolamine ammonia-lyase small subunit